MRQLTPCEHCALHRDRALAAEAEVRRLRIARDTALGKPLRSSVNGGAILTKAAELLKAHAEAYPALARDLAVVELMVADGRAALVAAERRALRADYRAETLAALPVDDEVPVELPELGATC